MGSSYQESWYKQVLKACALQDDLETMVHGDATEIGESGVTLSGVKLPNKAVLVAKISSKLTEHIHCPTHSIEALLKEHSL